MPDLSEQKHADMGGSFTRTDPLDYVFQPWIRGEPGAALDAFAVVMVRAGVRASLGSGSDKPPPYNRPPPKKPPPKPKSRKPPRAPPKTLILRAA